MSKIRIRGIQEAEALEEDGGQACACHYFFNMDSAKEYGFRERIADFEVSNSLLVLKVRGPQNPAIAGDRGTYYERVVKRDLHFTADREGL
jgi:hypothetical protein